jgi:hypothetical protein
LRLRWLPDLIEVVAQNLAPAPTFVESDFPCESKQSGR